MAASSPSARRTRRAFRSVSSRGKNVRRTRARLFSPARAPRRARATARARVGAPRSRTTHRRTSRRGRWRARRSSARDGRGRVRGERRGWSAAGAGPSSRSPATARRSRNPKTFHEGAEKHHGEPSSTSASSVIASAPSSSSAPSVTRTRRVRASSGSAAKRAPRPGLHRRRRGSRRATAAPVRPERRRERGINRKHGVSGRQRVIRRVRRFVHRCVVWVIEIVQGVRDRANRDQRAPFRLSSFGFSSHRLAVSALRRGSVEPARAAGGARFLVVLHDGTRCLMMMLRVLADVHERRRGPPSSGARCSRRRAQVSASERESDAAMPRSLRPRPTPRARRQQRASVRRAARRREPTCQTRQHFEPPPVIVEPFAAARAQFRPVHVSRARWARRRCLCVSRARALPCAAASKPDAPTRTAPARATTASASAALFSDDAETASRSEGSRGSSFPEATRARGAVRSTSAWLIRRQIRSEGEEPNPCDWRR